MFEYPRAEGDPYYPIPQPKNTELYLKYKAMADALPDVHFVGRLGTYKYYNMDQVVAQALTEFERLSSRRIAPARKVTIALPQSIFNLDTKAAGVEKTDGEAA